MKDLGGEAAVKMSKADTGIAHSSTHQGCSAFIGIIIIIIIFFYIIFIIIVTIFTTVILITHK